MPKRIFDIIAAGVACLALAPLMVAIAIWIRLDSRGAAVFRQRRCGRGGRPFTMLKFRTMRTDCDPYGQSPNSGDDPRLTRPGRFLRRTSLDELPQLLNIIAGQMSVVGPRPLYERQAESWTPRQRRRLEVRPGLTGMAQAYGRASLTIEDKLEMDVFYVDHRSLWLDVHIIMRTALNLFHGPGDIYEKRYSRVKERESD